MAKTVEDARAQLAVLDFKFGVGQGAAKERAKLERIIEAGGQKSPRQPAKKKQQAVKKKPKIEQPKKKLVKTDKSEPQKQADLDAKISKALRGSR